MDADSSYGGSDTAQDCHSGNNSSLETSTTAPHDEITITTNPPTTPSINTNPMSSNNINSNDTNNTFYHKNEIVLPVNYDETDFKQNLPHESHYLSTANLNIDNNELAGSNLETVSKTFKSTNQLNVTDTPKTRKKSTVGIDNPAFQQDETNNGHVKSTFDQNKPYNGELNNTIGLTNNKHDDEQLTEAVNLELINLKPNNSSGKDVVGQYENINNGMTTIPIKKESDVEIGNPYDEYFVPVNQHRKYMRYCNNCL